MGEEISQEERMLEMLRSEKQDLESEVCRFRVMKAKLLQQIAYVRLPYLCHFFEEQRSHFMSHYLFRPTQLCACSPWLNLLLGVMTTLVVQVEQSLCVCVHVCLCVQTTLTFGLNIDLDSWHTGSL